MYKDILFPIDLLETSSWKQAVSVIREYANAFKPRIHVMTVVPDIGMNIVSQYISDDAADKIIKETTKALHRFTEEHMKGVDKLHHIVTQGVVYKSIIDTSRRIKADLVIMSAHRPELKDYLLGPNAARVVRHSECSVLVVRH
ncbi:MAG: universal stress protein [Proteobacteria bacterium]|nr:universal stress protein [Pseudomonadota bacterium]